MNVIRKLLTKRGYCTKLFSSAPQKYALACVKYKYIQHKQRTTNCYCTGISNISFESPAVQKYLKTLVTEYNTLQAKDYSEDNDRKRLEELKPTITLIKERSTLKENLLTIKELISGSSEDKVFLSAAEEEQQTYQQRIHELENTLLTVLVPVDNEDNCCDIVLEVSAGVGGQEAMLFAREIFDMYCNYVTHKDWDLQIAQLDTTELGGLRHASLLISGENVYQYMKHEAGIHRVQRVPMTEKSGRVHTSTISVAVFPQPEELGVVLHDKDLKIETKRASGAGGQHVNKTESAVRITHLPTGISVECQVDRSQIKNREIAMQTLKARIYNQQLQEQESRLHTTRKQQVGSSMRSEKIRTYNFSQDRITDHRLSANIHNMRNFLLGGEMLDNLVLQLEAVRNKERLLHVLSSVESS